MKKYLIALLSILCLTLSACFVAQTTQTFDVTFVSEGRQLGKITLNKGQKLSAEDSRIPSLPTELGYTFSWDNDVTKITENTTVNAIKTANTYVVTLDPNGGEIGYSQITVTFGQPFAIDEPFEGKDKKGFAGWFCDGVLVDVTKEWSIADNVTLKAMWQQGDQWSGWYE